MRLTAFKVRFFTRRLIIPFKPPISGWHLLRRLTIIFALIPIWIVISPLLPIPVRRESDLPIIDDFRVHLLHPSVLLDSRQSLLLFLFNPVNIIEHRFHFFLFQPYLPREVFDIIHMFWLLVVIHILHHILFSFTEIRIFLLKLIKFKVLRWWLGSERGRSKVRYLGGSQSFLVSLRARVRELLTVLGLVSEGEHLFYIWVISLS